MAARRASTPKKPNRKKATDSKPERRAKAKKAAPSKKDTPKKKSPKKSGSAKKGLKKEQATKKKAAKAPPKKGAATSKKAKGQKKTEKKAAKKSATQKKSSANKGAAAKSNAKATSHKKATSKKKATKKKATPKKSASSSQKRASPGKKAGPGKKASAKKQSKPTKATSTKKTSPKKKASPRKGVTKKSAPTEVRKATMTRPTLAKKGAGKDPEKARAPKVRRHRPDPTLAEMPAATELAHLGLGARRVVVLEGPPHPAFDRVLRSREGTEQLGSELGLHPATPPDPRRPVPREVKLPPGVFPPPPPPPMPLSDGRVEDAVGSLLTKSPDAGHLGDELLTVASFFAGEDIPEEWPDSGYHWATLVGRPGLLAVRAASHTAGRRERRGLVRLLEVWAETPFCSEAHRCRTVVVQVDPEACPFSFQTVGGVRTALGLARSAHGKHRYFLKSLPDSEHTLVLELAPTTPGSSEPAGFELPPGTKGVRDDTGAPLERRCGRHWGTAEQIQTLLEWIDVEGPVPYQHDVVQLFMRETGLAEAEAALLLLGVPPGVSVYEEDFLAPAARAPLRLPVSQLAAARDRLVELGAQHLLDLYRDLLPEDPGDLWRDLRGPRPDATHPGLLSRDHFPGALARAWVERHGRHLEPAATLVNSIGADLELKAEPEVVLQEVANAPNAPRLGRDAAWRPASSSRFAPDDPDAFNADTLGDAVRAFVYVASELPVGHPHRIHLPEMLATLRRRLANPRLWLPLGIWCFAPDHDLEKAKEFLQAQLEAGTPTFRVLGVDDEPPLGEPLAGTLTTQGPTSWLRVFFNPSAIDQFDAPPLSSWLETCENPSPELRLVALAGSRGFTRIARRVERTPVPEGSYEANPLHSAPEVVEAAARRLRLDAETAALYLQVLTLARPSANHLKTWNDWTKLEITQRASKLIERGLLVRARRARAGRDFFLPGAYLEDAPQPLERWKLPLYDLELDARGDLHAPLGSVLPLRPLHELFALAWRRILAGDAPKEAEPERQPAPEESEGEEPVARARSDTDEAARSDTGEAARSDAGEAERSDAGEAGDVSTSPEGEPGEGRRDEQPVHEAPTEATHDEPRAAES